ncbi:MAG: hypothetical protein NTW19_21915 [Planctomycetota bacterium]|nr:hypothetical protein [Planctomycetota bacterium]
MPPTRPNLFAPPTPEQVRRHLERHAARGPSALRLWAPLAILILVVGVLILGGSSPVTVVGAWMVLGIAMLLRAMQRRWVQGLEARAVRAQELALRRHWPQSLRLAWRALPSIVSFPELHARLIAVIAHDLDQLKAYDSAIAAYDFLIERLPADHPASVQFRVQRALTELACDHLTDADQTLRRLRSVIDPYHGTITAAGYRLATLLQQIRTNHFADAVEDSDGLVDELRPLGVDAGYGHALLALAFARLAAGEPPPSQVIDESSTTRSEGEPAAPAQPEVTPAERSAELRRKAGLWWSRATLLLPVEALLDRFPELDYLLRAAPAPALPPVPPATSTPPEIRVVPGTPGATSEA